MHRNAPSPPSRTSARVPGARALGLAVVSGLLAACTTAVPAPTPAATGPARPAVASFAGFPDDSTDRSVWVEARFPEVGEPGGAGDWTPQGVLPVHLTVGHLDAEWERPRLSRDTFDARLYLADGTVLGWVGPRAEGQTVGVQRAQVERGLSFSLLPPWERAAEGLVFFALGEGVRVVGERARLGGEDAPREVDLDGSLLTFQVETATGSRQVRVGVRYGGGP